MSNGTGGLKTLERGDVYFLFRPRVEEEQPEGMGDIQNLYMVLSPRGTSEYRMSVVGRERMPDPEKSGHRKYWGFVARVERDPKELAGDLQAEEYQTETRGERHQPAARPVGEGVYRILRHGDHTHLVYALELPEQPDEVQRELNVEEEASYVLSIKNPSKPSPPGAGLSPEQAADYPKRLMELFRGRRFAEADPPDFLSHEGCEFVLISASGDISAELGVELEPQRESYDTAEIFEDLRLDRRKHPVKPLLEGEWD